MVWGAEMVADRFVANNWFEALVFNSPQGISVSIMLRGLAHIRGTVIHHTLATCFFASLHSSCASIRRGHDW